MSTTNRSSQPDPKTTNQGEGIGRGAWMALAAALLASMFDGAEMGLFSMVGRSALRELLGINDESKVGFWFGVVTAGFLVGAATGGVLFGWLGDRIGRVRAMTLSVLTYAVFTGLCGFAGAAWQLYVLRFLAALGMGGEWSLGVALVMEVWPNRSRALMAGLIGAAANVGYLLVGVIGLAFASVTKELPGWLSAVGLPDAAVSMLTANQGWRLLMILGTAPAILTFFIRIFVPESTRWKEEKSKGNTSHWATRDLLGVLVGALGPALTVIVWAHHQSYIAEKLASPYSVTMRVGVTVFGLLLATAGYTYPVVRYLQRESASQKGVAMPWKGTIGRMLLAACLSGVALLGTWGSAQWAPSWADQLTGSNMPEVKAWTQMYSAFGAIVGTIAAALVGGWIGRRITYCILCIAAWLSAVGLFQFNDRYGTSFLVATFIMGLCTASFYGWLPLYLPELFRTRVRATGQGFGFNFGRILAAVGTLQTGALMGIFPALDKPQKLYALNLEAFRSGQYESMLQGGYPQACTVMSMIYFVGMIIIWFAPETHGRPLPE